MAVALTVAVGDYFEQCVIGNDITSNLGDWNVNQNRIENVMLSALCCHYQSTNWGMDAGEVRVLFTTFK